MRCNSYARSVTSAQRRALLAIQMRGGEISEFRRGGRRSWAALDQYGGAIEEFNRRVIDNLAARGFLRFARFEAGGAVFRVTVEPEARAAFVR